jgi:hypothetical protein
MAYTFSVNNTPSTNAVAMYQLVAALMSAGWLKMMDSDGTTYSSTGVQVTHGGTGTGGLGNTSSWVRLQSPPTNGGAIVNQTRELTIQRGTTDVLWRIKYSAYGNFTGGVPTATATPTNETAGAYSETNQDATTSLNNTVFGAGQSFVGNGSALISARFFLKKASSPTGQAFAKVYAHTGSFGTASVPTGAALATSLPLDVSTLTTSYALIDFKFTGANQITLTNATNYVVTIEYADGTVGNTLDVGRDGSAPTASGNFATFSSAIWTAVSGSDMCFYVMTGIQDEVFMIGGGTDVSPTFLSWFGTNSTYRWHIACGGAAEFYSFIAWAAIIGTSAGSVAISLDHMASGSYSILDVDPAVMYCSVSTSTSALSEIISNGFTTSNVTNPSRARAWLGSTSSAGASLTTNNVNVGIVCYGSNVIGNGGSLGSNTLTHDDDLMPCLWGCGNASFPRGMKGFSTLFKVGTIVRRSMTTCDTISLGSKDKIFFNGLWLPWGGVVPII